MDKNLSTDIHGSKGMNPNHIRLTILNWNCISEQLFPGLSINFDGSCIFVNRHQQLKKSCIKAFMVPRGCWLYWFVDFPMSATNTIFLNFFCSQLNFNTYWMDINQSNFICIAHIHKSQFVSQLIGINKVWHPLFLILNKSKEKITQNPINRVKSIETSERATCEGPSLSTIHHHCPQSTIIVHNPPSLSTIHYHCPQATITVHNPLSLSTIHYHCPQSTITVPQSTITVHKLPSLPTIHHHCPQSTITVHNPPSWSTIHYHCQQATITVHNPLSLSTIHY